ncbi:hypothetical protein FHX42_004151 [Saccharopolyspora lacisalsi]|uniref:Uncharacterized protein n=1 Tax=Halosaccharopolyspora lacisalsi TaxID=1000566 RepID=A0A839DXT5_9PSEU|nr:hypothetical protein [Halosaccharopolyspora lacisalsi]MBA8826772.1 hypothetical protein [Halosaccharopolyspora lacisalsi]
MSEPSAGGPERAAAHYKEITSVATEAVDRTHEHERKKAAGLEDEVAAGQDRIETAQQRENEVAEGVRLRWDGALEALWNERWLRVTRMPKPDPDAAPAPAEESLRAVQVAYLALRNALDRPRWSASSLLPKSRRRGG